MTSPDNLDKRYPSTLVAIVVPIYKDRLSPEESISFNHVTRFLGEYEKYVIAPKHLKVQFPGFYTKLFDDHAFTSVGSYSKLLLSQQFYEAFEDYKYILIYQLDCLIFSDELIEWCKADYDYIGAPWFKSKTEPSKGFSRVGNGGLSLRNVDAFLRVLNAKRYSEDCVSYLKDLLASDLDDLYALSPLKRFIKKLRVFRDVRRGVRWYTHHYTLNEDHFWTDRAKLFYPGFNIAPVDIALRFSFERFPRYCFLQNNFQLPFGCHAWTRWDREFWEPYLLRY
jgi:hypothetical protein